MNKNHDVSIGVMIDKDDEERIGLLGRPAELQFVRLASAYNEIKQALADEQARGIHSCGPDCGRMACVQRREIERTKADLLAWREIAEKAISLAAKWEKEAAVYRANIEEAEAKGLQSNEMRGHKTQLLACAKELRMIEKARGE